MQKNIEFIRKLPIPKDVKEQYPLKEEYTQKKNLRDAEIADIFEGRSDKLILVIGPCSADREDAVLDYISRLCGVQEKVEDKILIIPRIYTNKPRTTGDGYKGMIHQPDPSAAEDMLEGIIATRRLHTRVIEQTGFFCADEMLYPENFRYLSDLLSYVAVGARSVENQQHRLTASGVDIPVGMKNPTGGDISVMLNSITAAQHPHTFLYRGWECRSKGNPLTHAILRGYVTRAGEYVSNYHYKDLEDLATEYEARKLQNPALIVDANHANSGKQYDRQGDICRDVLASGKRSAQIKRLVKGFMIESYIEDGSQKTCEVYGKSITDPCLGWEKTERLIYELADLS